MIILRSRTFTEVKLSTLMWEKKATIYMLDTKTFLSYCLVNCTETDREKLQSFHTTPQVVRSIFSVSLQSSPLVQFSDCRRPGQHASLIHHSPSQVSRICLMRTFKRGHSNFRTLGSVPLDIQWHRCVQSAHKAIVLHKAN